MLMPYLANAALRAGAAWAAVAHCSGLAAPEHDCDSGTMARICASVIEPVAPVAPLAGDATGLADGALVDAVWDVVCTDTKVMNVPGAATDGCNGTAGAIPADVVCAWDTAVGCIALVGCASPDGRVTVVVM